MVLVFDLGGGLGLVRLHLIMLVAQIRSFADSLVRASYSTTCR